MPASPRWRAVRTIVFAVAAGQLATLGHVAGNGHGPDPALLLLALAASALAVHPLTRRRLGFPVLVAATTASQVLFHLLFTLGAHPAGMTGMPGTVPGISPAAAWAPMVAFHLAAAVATAALLAHGESALFRLLAAWRRTVQRVRSRPAVGVASRRIGIAPPRVVTTLSGAQLAAVRVMRGPPGAVPAR